MSLIFFMLFGCQSQPLVVKNKASNTNDQDSTSTSVDSAAGDESELNDLTVEPQRAETHLQALYEIALANNNNRAVGSSGYAASVDYVQQKLNDAGYTVTIQDFPVSSYDVLAEPQLRIDGEAYQDIAVFEFSAAGTVEGLVQAVDLYLPPGMEPNTSTSGCETSDFANFTAGRIALLQRGTCTFYEKVKNAQAAGAIGVIIFNEGQAGRQDVFYSTLSQTDLVIPSLATSYPVGQQVLYAAQNDQIVSFTIEAELSEVISQNILAERNEGDADKVIVVGGHLDSVPQGPGINDNGSGVAGILAIAEQLAADTFSSQNRLRFAFWGAEEVGLVGSFNYLAALEEQQAAKILANLNFDMVASPNHIRMIYDGDGSDAGQSGPNGSAEIEAAFELFFQEKELEYTSTPFDGRSDYGPFIMMGIPAGGLFSGAEGLKSSAEANQFGGTENLAYDPCYHQDCDELDNISAAGLQDMIAAMEYAVRWAADTSELRSRRPIQADWRKRFFGNEFRGHKLQK